MKRNIKQFRDGLKFMLDNFSLIQALKEGKKYLGSEEEKNENELKTIGDSFFATEEEARKSGLKHLYEVECKEECCTLKKLNDSFKEIKEIAEDHDDKPLEKQKIDFDFKKIIRTNYIGDKKIEDLSVEERNAAIDKLIKDEEDAIKGYEEAMKDADEKTKALYSHIITEELEHIEELKNLKETKDSAPEETKTETKDSLIGLGMVVKAVNAYNDGRKYLISTSKDNYFGEDEDFFEYGDLEAMKKKCDECKDKCYINEIEVGEDFIKAKTIYENKAEVEDSCAKDCDDACDCKDEAIDTETLSGYEKELSEVLGDIAYEYVDIPKSLTKPTNVFQLNVSIDGDWKHDHGACDELVEKWAEGKDMKVLRSDETVLEENGSDSYKALHSYVISEKGEVQPVATADSFEEIDKGMKKPDGKPLEKKDVEIDAEAVQAKKIVEDSRAYIGEYNEYFYEHYRGVNVYKKAEDKFEAEVLGKVISGKTGEEARELIDEVIKENVDEYSKESKVQPESRKEI